MTIRAAFSALSLAALAACGSSSIVQAGDVAPQWSLPSTNGSVLSPASFQGKAVYLNFFATWCEPCNDEAPAINKLQKKYASRGLAVIGVDEQEDLRKARAFRQKYGLVYPAVVDSGTLGEKYAVNGLPVHVFIARNGKIDQIRIGQMSTADIEAAIKKIVSS